MSNRINESLFYRLARIIHKLTRPRMIGRRKNFQGKKVIDSSIGNTTLLIFQKIFILAIIPTSGITILLKQVMVLKLEMDAKLQILLVLLRIQVIIQFDSMEINSTVN